MSMDPGLQALHARLDAIAGALDTDDLAAAAAAAADYDAELRGYLAACTPGQAPTEALRELLQLQNALLLRMAERQEGIAGELRQVRKAGRASRAYAATEMAR